MSFKDFMGVSPEDFVKNGHKLIQDSFEKIEPEIIPQIRKKRISDAERLYREYQRENEMIFRAALKPNIVGISQKITDLPTYGQHLLPYLVDKKKADLEYLYKIAKERDILGEMRIPGACFPNFSEIPYERLKMLEPIITSKNDAGMWNYGPSFIWHLDNKYSDKQIEIMSRLAKYKVNGMNLRLIAEHPYLNHQIVIEKAKSINELFGKDLREINFFSTHNGENYICIDVQNPHNDKKTDYMNFRRLYAKVGINEAPLEQPLNVPEIDKFTQNMYKKLEKELGIFTPEKLENAIEEVYKAIPECNDIDTLRVMQKLTQFANYNSLKHVTKELANYKIYKINPDWGLNSIFNYFTKTKYIVDLPFQDGEKYHGLLITKEDLQNNGFNKELRELQLYDDIRFINLEGWSDGINLFNDNNLLAEKTIRVLKKTRKLMAKKPEYSFNAALDKVLNNHIDKQLKKYGLQYKTISIDAPATRQTILEQMNPEMPTQSLIKSTIESVANFYTKNKKKHKNLSLRIAKYYDENIEIYTKQRMIENLKELGKQVENYRKTHKIKPENIYFITPITKQPVKSFDIVNKMFAGVMNIPEERILRINHFKQIENLPDNSVFIIADDLTASGASMAEAGDYMYYAKNISDKKHILFCPISTTKEGLNYINYNIDNQDRIGTDAILYLKKNSKSYKLTTEKFIGKEDIDLNAEVFGEPGHGELGMCTAFPYMAPDNNSTLSSFLVKFFTPTKDCIKNKNPYITEIEKNTYYYDIFGTDEKHAPTKIKTQTTLTDKIKEKLRFLKNIL